MLARAAVRGSIVSYFTTRVAPNLGALSNTTLKLDDLINFVNARFFSCGAANGFFNPFP